MPNRSCTALKNTSSLWSLTKTASSDTRAHVLSSASSSGVVKLLPRACFLEVVGLKAVAGRPEEGGVASGMPALDVGLLSTARRGPFTVDVVDAGLPVGGTFWDLSVLVAALIMVG